MSLAEFEESIKRIWTDLVLEHSDRNFDLNQVQELPMIAILDWLVKEQVSQNRDRASGVIDSLIGSQRFSEDSIHYDEFSKLFQKGMFKATLIRIAAKFEKTQKSGLSLGRKLD